MVLPLSLYEAPDCSYKLLVMDSCSPDLMTRFPENNQSSCRLFLEDWCPGSSKQMLKNSKCHIPLQTSLDTPPPQHGI